MDATDRQALQRIIWLLTKQLDRQSHARGCPALKVRDGCSDDCKFVQAAIIEAEAALDRVSGQAGDAIC